MAGRIRRKGKKPSGKYTPLGEVRSAGRLATGRSPERIAMARDELAFLERKAELTEAESDALHGHGPKKLKDKAVEKIKKAVEKM